MTTKDKRYPALNDKDKIPFGKYKDLPMQDVPSSYLKWLYNQGCTNVSVANYIHNSMDSILMECPDQIR